jgi:hypothetical protein
MFGNAARVREVSEDIAGPRVMQYAGRTRQCNCATVQRRNCTIPNAYVGSFNSADNASIPRSTARS